MFARMQNETLGKLHFWFTFIGVYAIFVPFHILGIAGHPRRYADSLNFEFLRALDPLHLFITLAAIATALAQIIFLINFFGSLWVGKKAVENPWEATTLEWTTVTPVSDNFAGKLPIVYRDPYQYSAPGETKDFLMQTEP
jgi:cytochrome c oxidase subunit 1